MPNGHDYTQCSARRGASGTGSDHPTVAPAETLLHEGLTYYLMPILTVFLLSLLAYLPAAAQPLSLENALTKPILAANQALVEVQVYTASHVKSIPLVSTAQQWTQAKEQLRKQLLNEVVLRGAGPPMGRGEDSRGMARRASRPGLSHQATSLRGGARPVDSCAAVRACET